MTSLALQDPKSIVSDHLAVLRDYATRVLRQGESLTPTEEADRTSRMAEFRAIGSSFKLTDHEMVVLVYKGLLTPKRGCACYSCSRRIAH
ncbi:MAG: hypothetical protein ACE5JL_14255 [Dehalococcoidia bacterium]